MSEILSLIGLSVGFASLGIAIIVSHRQGNLQKSIENERKKEEDTNVLHLLNAYKNFIINLRHVRRFQQNVDLLEKNGTDEELYMMENNLNFNIKGTVQRAQDISRLLEYNLKYFPKSAYKIFTWNNLVGKNIVELEKNHLNKKSLFEIEWTITSMMDFLKDYDIQMPDMEKNIQYYLEFYNDHQKSVKRNKMKNVNEHIHPVYDAF